MTSLRLTLTALWLPVSPRGGRCEPGGLRAVRRRLHPVHARRAHFRVQQPGDRPDGGSGAVEPPPGEHASERRGPPAGDAAGHRGGQ